MTALIVVGFVAAADLINNATNTHRTPPIIIDARKSSQRRKGRPMVASEKIKKRFLFVKSLSESGRTLSAEKTCLRSVV